jgi:hypothetical protein
MHCDETSVNDVSFSSALSELLVKENNFAASIFDRLSRLQSNLHGCQHCVMLDETFQGWQQGHHLSALQWLTKSHHSGTQ